MRLAEMSVTVVYRITFFNALRFETDWETDRWKRIRTVDWAGAKATDGLMDQHSEI